MCGRSGRLFLCSFPPFHLVGRRKPGQERSPSPSKLVGLDGAGLRSLSTDWRLISCFSRGGGATGSLLIFIRIYAAHSSLGHAMAGHLEPERVHPLPLLSSRTEPTALKLPSSRKLYRRRDESNETALEIHVIVQAQNSPLLIHGSPVMWQRPAHQLL